MSPSSVLPAARFHFATIVRPIHRLHARAVAGLAGLVAGFALGLAYAAEYRGGFLPCSLCLLERWPYRLTIGLAALALLMPGRAIRPLLWLIAIALLANVGLAVIHVGVEQHLWDNPIAECAAPRLGGLSLLEQMLQLSSGHRFHAIVRPTSFPSCRFLWLP